MGLVDSHDAPHLSQQATTSRKLPWVMQEAVEMLSESEQEQTHVGAVIRLGRQTNRNRGRDDKDYEILLTAW